MSPETDPSEERERCLRAGTRALRRRGFDRVSLVDVANAAGVPSDRLKRYFVTKEDLLSAVSVETNAEILVHTKPDPDLAPRARLRDCLGSYLTFVDANTFIFDAIERFRGTGDARVGAPSEVMVQVQRRRILDALGESVSASPAVDLLVTSWVRLVRDTALPWVRLSPASRRMARGALAEMLEFPLVSICRRQGIVLPNQQGQRG